MGWLQLRLVATANDVEALEDALLAAGALAVTLGDHRDVPILEPGVGETPLWPEVELIALFDEDTDREELGTRLVAACGPMATPASWEHIEDRAWEREWLQHFEPLRFGRHFWVCPGGMSVPDADATILQLDPGLAFGTGTHPSTALCLEWLATQPLDGLHVIDYGCGSGILAIAALLLGATTARAVDIDPQALEATRANARRNGLPADALTIGEPAMLDDAVAAADLLLANILAGPLIELAPRLARLVMPGGHAVLSGILCEQEAMVRTAWAPWFEHLDTVENDSWCRIVLRRTTESVA